MTRILAFPRVQNRAFVKRHARRMLAMNSAAAERHLERLLTDQAAVMHRRGIDEAIVKEDTAAVEAAIRCEVWHLIMRNPGGAA